MADLNTISAQLDKAIADFKTQSEQIAELEKQGKSVAEMKASMDRCNDEISNLTAKLEQARAEAEERSDELEARWERMAHQGALGGKDEKAANARAFFAAVYDKPASEVTPDVDAYNEYCKAFANFVRRGPDAIASGMRAALSVGSDPDGGYWVPAEMDSRIVERLFKTSPMRQVASVMTIGSDALEFPNDTNDATLGGWVGETASRAESATPQVGKQRIEVHEHYAQPKVTQKLLDDGVIDVEGWLSRKIGSKFIRTENNAFVTGDGVSKPRGFLDYTTAATADASRTWGTLEHVASGASGAFAKWSGTGADDFGPFEDLIAALNPEYIQGSAFAMNSLTFANVRKMRDVDGRPFWDRSLRDGFTFELAGFPVVIMEDMPNIGADSLSIAFGNWSEAYQIVDRFGTRILRDPFTEKPYVKFYSTRRVGGAVRNFDALKFLKFAAS